MLEELKSKNKLVGIKQTKKALEAGTAKVVYLALDADKRILDEFRQICQQNQVSVVDVDSMKDLGKACGIDVSAAIACLLNN